MTKTLTEQWQKGELKEGYYYTLLNTDSKMIEINYCWDDGCFQDYCDNLIDEVLAPVPSYNEHTELVQKMHILEKKLEIATKALKETKEKLLHVELSGLDGNNRQKMYDLMFEDGVIDKALKEMEGVK